MQIKQISVTGLFGIFDHVIPLNMDERITIIHSPNGYGKTAILRLLNGFFNSQYSIFKDISFNTFEIELDTTSRIEVVKSCDKSREDDQLKFYFHLFNNERISFDPWSDRNFKFDNIQDKIPGLVSEDGKRWHYRPTGEVLNRNDIIERFEDLLVSFRVDPDWLKELKKNINVQLIESQRLFEIGNDKSPLVLIKETMIFPTVSRCSLELAQDMRNKLIEYSSVAQSLDRTFPVRIFKQKELGNLTDKEVRDRLSEIEVTRSTLVNIGLLDEEENQDTQIQFQDLSDNGVANVLSVYADDSEKKFSVFDDFAKKMSLLKKVINNKFSFSYKEMSFDKEIGFVFKSLRSFSSAKDQNATLLPVDLSSGEQHELVLVYELLFKAQPNSLVLIDEPEISLHVGWQVQFLKDLKEIITLTRSGFLIATHAPGIIENRWDLTVELKRPE